MFASMRYGILIAAAVVLCGCAASRPKESFQHLTEEFVYTTLANSPVAATQIGYHAHNNVRLDAILDDYSPHAVEQQRRWYQDFRLRLQESVDPKQLSPDDRADYDIIQDQISLLLLEFTSIQSYRHNPTLYVELIGNAAYAPYVLEYAPKEDRYRHIIERLRGIPTLLQQARRNLTNAPEIWTRVAQQENEGNMSLIEGELRQGCPEALRREYDQAAKNAVYALRVFNDWLRTDLSTRTYDWRLGRNFYAQKFRFVLATDASPDQVLAAAEKGMRDMRAQMFEIARAMPAGAGPGDQDTVIRRALDAISTRHSTPESYFPDARRDLAEATEFVKTKDLLTLPARSNLQVVETPEFMRGIYSVGGFNAAPPLEPQLGAFYWITPIPSNWPPARIESKLREYNYYGLQLLTLHEAMPGHYVQLEYSNDIQPPLRRIVRSVFGNTPYIEGWAVYATEMMLDAGYLNNDPALRLTFLKQQLRVLANAILDVRLQTMGMTDQQALSLLMDQAFQEREEAEGKLQRAKLSSAQLPAYFVGWRDWRRLRERYRQTRGSAYTLKDFNETALKAGAVPLPVLARLLSDKGL